MWLRDYDTGDSLLWYKLGSFLPYSFTIIRDEGSVWASSQPIPEGLRKFVAQNETAMWSSDDSEDQIEKGMQSMKRLLLMEKISCFQ